MDCINNYILVGTSFSESQNFSVLPEFNLAFQGDYFLLDGDLVSDKRIRLIAAFMMLVFGSLFCLSLIDDVQLRNTTKGYFLRPSSHEISRIFLIMHMILGEKKRSAMKIIYKLQSLLYCRNRYQS